MGELYKKLFDYSGSKEYAFHMPGHKRNDMFDFCNPYLIDITEIDGFDDLHCAEGILKECMEYAANVYGADESFFLVNGSTCGILSAVSAAADYKDMVIMARNCHKSVYNAVELRGLRPVYIYPEYIGEYSIFSGINVGRLQELIIENQQAKAVIITSPTYDGICSDIKNIAELAHSFGMLLIVDEAHGAHFKYDEYFPASAIELGADIVIQSLHKTLPSFTQTAIMHIKKKYTDVEKIKKYLSVYQSSSPSYVLMAGIDKCIRYMEGDGRQDMLEYVGNLKSLRQRLSKLNNLKLLDESVVGKYSANAYDCGKIIICAGSRMGRILYNLLREKYGIQPEMSTDTCVTLMTAVGDKPEALKYLGDVLLEIDKSWSFIANDEIYNAVNTSGKLVMTPSEALTKEKEAIAYKLSKGRLSAEYIYIYPPGIPLVAPGEHITDYDIDTMERYMAAGLKVRGINGGNIKVICDK